MPSRPATVAAYLDELPEDRREAVEVLRAAINANIGPEFEEGIQYGMLSWYLPHSVYPHGYHCSPDQPLPFASVASQKRHLGIYLFCTYTVPGERERLAEEWQATGCPLDMGKGCIRAKSIDDVPLKVLGKAIRRVTAKKFVAAYEDALPEKVKGKRSRAASAVGADSKAKSAKKSGVKKKVAKKPPARKRAEA